MSPRLTPVKRHRLVAVLRLNGFVQRPGRGKGSHAWFRHAGDPTRKTAVPADDEIDSVLLSRILSQAGKTREEFFARLREV
jgi:predicted RNA binding protein YcfA (HicA-like mRNA interferase family)